jgi:hypothetical protein
MSHGPKTQRPRELFKRTYQRDCFIRKEKLPATLPYLTPGCTVEAIELKAAGALLWNGRKLEFQDVRVYVTPAPIERPAVPDCPHETGADLRGNCLRCGAKIAKTVI